MERIEALACQELGWRHLQQNTCLPSKANIYSTCAQRFSLALVPDPRCLRWRLCPLTLNSCYSLNGGKPHSAGVRFFLFHFYKGFSDMGGVGLCWHVLLSQPERRRGIEEKMGRTVNPAIVSFCSDFSPTQSLVHWPPCCWPVIINQILYWSSRLTTCWAD